MTHLVQRRIKRKHLLYILLALRTARAPQENRTVPFEGANILVSRAPTQRLLESADARLDRATATKCRLNLSLDAVRAFSLSRFQRSQWIGAPLATSLTFVELAVLLVQVLDAVVPHLVRLAARVR